MTHLNLANGSIIIVCVILIVIHIGQAISAYRQYNRAKKDYDYHKNRHDVLCEVLKNNLNKN